MPARRQSAIQFRQFARQTLAAEMPERPLAAHRAVRRRGCTPGACGIAQSNFRRRSRVRLYSVIMTLARQFRPLIVDGSSGNIAECVAVRHRRVPVLALGRELADH